MRVQVLITILLQYFAPDTRTEQEKTDMLLEQFLGERDIELSHDPQSEIESRIAVLRKDGVKPNEGPYISNLHDSSSSDEEVDKITKKVCCKNLFSFIKQCFSFLKTF